MDNMMKCMPAVVVPSPITQPNKIESSDRNKGATEKNNERSKDIKTEMESEEEREKGWSDMTETEASDSDNDNDDDDDDDDSKLVIDVSSKLASKDLDSNRVRSLEETMKFLEGNRSMSQESSGGMESGEEESDEEIVFSSSGAPDKYGFLTEIYVPKMRGFEDLSDRCILDSVSVSLTLDQVVRSSMDQFNYFMRNTDLTDTQREITKYVRRRARNRVSARKSRMKKISDIVRLSTEIKVIQQKKDSLTQERMIMEKLKISWNKRVSVLEDYIVQYLKDHGEKDNVTLDFKDGKIVIVGEDNAVEIKAEKTEDV